MEIGCGDVPLMNGLVQSLFELESMTKIKASTVVNEIVAFDYSKCLIDVLLDKHQTEGPCVSNLKIEYLVHDARNLPYKDFSYDVIIDKGTLDAMLSDKEKGKENCIKIIAESARLLKLDGYIMIVSHLNANGATGMEWLNEVLGTGLKAGDKKANYRVEVHGNDDDDEDNLGPAVYIIKKVKMTTDEDSNYESTIDVKFLNY
jgi:SAM-dependent methyltransferase